MSSDHLLGFGLISSARFLFFSQDYEVAKRIQLHYMRNDLLYLLPVNKLMLRKYHVEAKMKQEPIREINEYNCTEFTTNNAPALQVELDVAPFRLRETHVRLAKPITEQEKQIASNLRVVSNVIEDFYNAVELRRKHTEQMFADTVKGYRMFQEFCELTIGKDKMLAGMFNKDIDDELSFNDTLDKLKGAFSNKILALDFGKPNLDIQNIFSTLSQEYPNKHAHAVLDRLKQ